MTILSRLCIGDLSCSDRSKADNCSRRVGSSSTTSNRSQSGVSNTVTNTTLLQLTFGLLGISIAWQRRARSDDGFGIHSNMRCHSQKIPRSQNSDSESDRFYRTRIRLSILESRIGRFYRTRIQPSISLKTVISSVTVGLKVGTIGSQDASR